MAVIEVRELNDRGGSADLSAAESTRNLRVRVDSPADTEFTIMADPRIPRYLAPHPGNLFSTCRRLQIRMLQHWQWWMVTAEYSTAPLQQDEKDRSENPNPLDRRARIRWSSQQYRKPVWKDRDGKAILNSAGQPFDPLPEIDASHWVATVTKNMTFVPSWLLEYEDAVNSDGYTIDGLSVEPKKSKLMHLDIGDVQEENGYEFRPVSFTIEFRKDGWDLEILDAGFEELADGPDGEPTRILDKRGNFVSHPWPLNADGLAIKPKPTPDNAHYIKSPSYEEKPFAVLPLQ